MNLTPESTIQQNSDFIHAEIDGETVMMSIDSGEYHGLDVIASRIWELIETPVTIDTLVAQIMDEYEVEKEQCQSDVTVFLEKMAEDKLIIVS